MEEILSSMRRITSGNENGSNATLVAPIHKKPVALTPETKPDSGSESELQLEAEHKPMAKPQPEPEPAQVEDVAASEEADQSDSDDHFDLTEVIAAIQKNSQFRHVLAATDRKIVAAVVSTWEELRAARKQIALDQSQVDTAKLALEGVRREGLAGSLSPLDVLDAEQQYLDAQVALISSRRDEVVASNELLASISRLTAEFLRLPVGSYDPTIH